MAHINIGFEAMYDASVYVLLLQCVHIGMKYPEYVRVRRARIPMSSLPSDFFDGHAGDAGGPKKKKKIANPSVVPVAAHRGGGQRGGTTEKKKKKDDDDDASAVEAAFSAELERDRRAAEDAALAEADARVQQRNLFSCLV